MEMGMTLNSGLCYFCVAFLFFETVFCNTSEANLKEVFSYETDVRNDADTSVRSFAERFLTRRSGRKMNLKRLLAEYALICPLRDSCGVDIEKKFLFHGDASSIFPGCPACSCEPWCVKSKSCCPGTHYGYIDFECINTTLFTTRGHRYVAMVSKCPKEYLGNTTLVEMCASSISPCTSVKSGLVYKNLHCSKCNKEKECTSWTETKVTCEISANLFDRINTLFASIASLSEMHNLYRKYNCEISLFPPANSSRLAFSCADRKYINTIYVNRCNITGLWRSYDADIDWACENLLLPYKEFKNVFCYICNPSIATIQNVALIDSCRNSTITRADVYDKCESLPTTSRLQPFKNIYCYACHQGEHTFTTHDYGFINVSEKINNLSLETELEFYILVWGQNKTLSLKRFFKNTFDESFQTPEPGRTLNRKSGLYKRSVSDYMSVCGTETVCNATLYQTNKTFGNPVCGRCDCDSQCAEHETCCPDIILQKYPYSCIGPQAWPSLLKRDSNSDVKRDQQLIPNVLGGRYKVIDTCIAKDIDDVLFEKCSSHGDHSDIFSTVPVTLDSGISYMNVYCYICNNNKSDIHLTAQVLCGAYIEHKLFTNMTQLLQAVNAYCFKVLFIPLKSKNCKMKYDSSKAGIAEGEKYVRGMSSLIETVTIIRSNRYNIVRTVYSTCNQTGKVIEDNEILNDVCESETENILSLPEYRINDRVYKNFACFLCNPDVKVSHIDTFNIISNCLLNSSEHYWINKDLEELCYVSEFHSRWFPFKNMYCSECNLLPWQRVITYADVIDGGALSTTKLQYIFSLSRDDFENLMSAPELGDIPQCSSGTFDSNLKQCRSVYCNPGFQLFNNTCIPLLESQSNLQYRTDFKLQYLHGKMENISENDEEDTSIIIDLNDLCFRILDIITQPFQETAEYSAMSECSLPVFPLHYSFYDISSGSIDVQVFLDITYTEKISLIQRSLVKAQNKTYQIRNIFDIDGIPWSIDFISEKNRFDFFKDTAKWDDTDVMLFPIVVDKLFLCPLVKVNFSEVYLKLDTGSIHLREKNMSFTFDEYKVIEKMIVICVDQYNRKIKEASKEQDLIESSSIESVYSMFALVCSLASMVCLVLTFVTYSLFPSLRTIPGQNIMTLCFFLFCSQAFLQFGLDVSKATALCKIIGVCIHYCWLAFFCAMNICSFHIYRVFVCKDIMNRLPSRFLVVKYLIYTISLPMVCVFLSVSIHLINSEGSLFGYGEKACFISDFYIFVGTFLIPACATFVSNIVFFVAAFHKIRTARRVQSTHERNNFYICLKLCTIVGVTWPLLIVDNIMQMAWLSFVVAGVNSLQGVFIFFSFVCNRKVANLYSSCIRRSSIKGGNKTAVVDKVTTSVNKTNLASVDQSSINQHKSSKRY